MALFEALWCAENSGFAHLLLVLINIPVLILIFQFLIFMSLQKDNYRDPAWESHCSGDINHQP